MTVYAVFCQGKERKSPKVVAHPSVQEARNSGNGFALVKTQEDLSDTNIFPTGVLVDIYNSTAEKKIAKFRDRTTAEKRTFKTISSFKAKDSSNAGRNSKYIDCKFEAVSKDNPRRKGTHGWKFYEFIVSNPRISYKDIASKWGAAKFTHHLSHDISAGNIKVIKQ